MIQGKVIDVGLKEDETNLGFFHTEKSQIDSGILQEGEPARVHLDTEASRVGITDRITCTRTCFLDSCRTCK